MKKHVCLFCAAVVVAVYATEPVTDCYWHWMNGNVSTNGITADLEYLKAGGVDAAMIFDVGIGVERGPVDYNSREWKNCVIWSCKEAERLGMELSLHNSPGYSAMGGPWITPEESMKELTWRVVGSDELGAESLPPHKHGYYREIAAIPLSTADETIEINKRLEANESITIPLDGEKDIVAINLWRGEREKPLDPFDGPRDYAPRVTIAGMGAIAMPVLRARDASGRLVLKNPVKAKEIKLTVSRGANIARMEVISSTPANGRVLRIGYTTTGQCVTAAPDAGRGLECDKFNRKGVDAHFAKFLGPLLGELKPWCGTTLKNIVMDSWEAGKQDWTEDFPVEFKARRGYDMTPYLACLTGREVQGRQWTLRFLMDYEQTKQELFIDNFIKPFKEHLAKYNLKYAGEPYGDGDFTTETLAPLIDLPMSEYWARSHYGTVERVKRVNNASPNASVHGCEFATAYPGDADIEPTLVNFKDDIDVLVACGVNRFTFHCVAHQPSDTSRLTMGPFGTRFDRAHCTVAQLREITDYIKDTIESAKLSKTGVYQWSVEVPEVISKETKEHPRAYLWIPERCEKLRGVVVGNDNMLEETLFAHGDFRRQLAASDIAAVFVQSGFQGFNEKCDAEDAQVVFKTLARLGDVSGYDELGSVPVAALGHSAWADWPYFMAFCAPERTFAAVSLKGSWPHVKPFKEGFSERLHGVPTLLVSGEYEGCENHLRNGAAYYETQTNGCFKIVCDWGSGHFDYSPELPGVLGKFLRDCLTQSRGDAETANSDFSDAFANAHASLTGRALASLSDKSELNFAAPPRDKKVALMGFRTKDGTVVEQNPKYHLQITIPWEPEEDGKTFTLDPIYLDTVPPGRPEGWTGKKAGESVDHPDDASSIEVDIVQGGGVKLGPNRFRVQFDRRGFMGYRARELVIKEVSPAQGEFKRSVQQAILRFPLKAREGQVAEPTGWFVREGAAEVDGKGNVTWLPLPPRARSPHAVTLCKYRREPNGETVYQYETRIR